MTATPYASPQAITEPVVDAAREIRGVTRAFQWIGWVGTVLYPSQKLYGPEDEDGTKLLLPAASSDT